MPIPQPEKNEDKSKYLARCMSDEAMKTEYTDTKKRVAVCMSKANDYIDLSLLEAVQDNLLAANCSWDDEWNEFTWETECSEIYDENDHLVAAEHGGKKVTLNKPFRTPDGPKKFAVYVKNEKGKVVIVRFGDPNMKIKKNIPERRKSFRARHKCDQAKDKTTPRYWSCKMW